MQEQKQPLPFLLKVIQIINYVSVGVVGLMAVLYFALPADNAALQMQQGVEPLNKYVVGLVAAVCAVLAACLAYLINARKAKTITFYVAITLVSVPLAEVMYYFASYPMTHLERVFYYSIELGLVLYMLRSKKVAAVLNR